MRKQFTFYHSFLVALRNVPRRQQAELLLAVCEYALEDQEPQHLSKVSKACFELIRPNLDTARRKSRASKGINNNEASPGNPQGIPGESSGNPLPVSDGNNKGENKIESELESELEIESELKLKSEIELKAEAEVESKGDSLAATAAERKLKMMHGELGQGVVLLSECQIEDLLNQMDLDAFDHYVAQLSNYILKKEAHIANHYATILRWWREDGALEAERKGRKP